MTQGTLSQLWVSEKTKTVGLRLIKDLNIQKQDGVAFFLQVNRCFDDQQATFVWLEHYFEDQAQDADYATIRQAFLNHFPECAFAS